ncbi:Uncharacterised protein [Turicibacter sanguinis]|nr:Uncharacterised protein [Turicibacter sanguinis]
MEIGVIVVFIMGYLTGRMKNSLIFSYILNKNEKERYAKRGMNIDKKDFYYWLLLMSVVCIMWISSDLYLNDNFVEYISFAGTITSILLGLLAIFYSFVQSLDGNNSIKTLQDISSDLAEYSGEINGKISEFNGLSNELKVSNKNLDEQLQNVTQKLDRMYDNLNKMSQQIESITEDKDIKAKEWENKDTMVTR